VSEMCFRILALACLENLTSACSPAESRHLLLFAIAFSGAAAVGISYTTAWCVRTTSSTTYRLVMTLVFFLSLELIRICI
jgi:hypothetical protein